MLAEVRVSGHPLAWRKSQRRETPWSKL